MTEVRHPLAPLVDLFVYAPIGMAVVAKERLPELIGEGRQRVETRVRVARMVGEFAVTMGRKELEKRLADLGTPVGDRQEAAKVAPEPAPVDDWSEFVAEAAVGPVAPTVDELPIPGYESLAASQVVDRLAALTATELDVVRRYEAAGRHRRTILHRIDQLVG